MLQDELIALVSKTAALMEQFERRCNEIEQDQQGLIQHTRQLAQQLPVVVRQSADETLSRISDAAMAHVRDGLERPVGAFDRHLRDAGAAIEGGAQSLAAQLQRMQRLHRQLSWKVFAIVLGSLSLLLAGGGWLSWQYRNDIRENKLAADLLRAYNQADVTLCDGRLCANVDARGAAYGERRQYRLVQPRR